MRLFALAILAVLFGTVLPAQQNIDVEYPAGTSVPSGGSVNIGDGGSSTVLTFTIENAGTVTNLVLDTSLSTRPCNCSAAKEVDWLLTQPATTTLAPGATTTFPVTVDPNGKGKWSVLLSIYSDDPDTPIYTILIKGTNGKEEKEDDCSTNEGSGLSLLMLLGAVSAAVVGLRLRSAR